MKHSDTRVRYTKTVLKESLLTLLYKKPIEKISVKELCEEAQINRSTFYLHYYSIDDILLEIETQYLEEYKKFFSTSSSKESRKEMLVEILQVIKSNKKLALTLCKNRIDHLEKIKELTQEPVIDWLKTKHPTSNKKQLDMIFNFFLFGAMRIIIMWIEDEIVCDAQELAEDLINLEEVFCNSIQ